MAAKKDIDWSGETLELGDTAMDPITGFRGVVIARTRWLQGCDRITLQPRKLTKDGMKTHSETFDAPGMVLIEKQTIKCKPDVDRTNGGPRPEIPRR